MPDTLIEQPHGKYTAEDVLLRPLKEDPFFLEIDMRMHEAKDHLETDQDSREIFRTSELPASFRRLIPRDHNSNWLRSALNLHMLSVPELRDYEIDDGRLPEDNIDYLSNFIYKIRLRKRGSIPEAPTPIAQIEALVQELKQRPVEEQKRALAALNQSQNGTWVERVAVKPTADVKLPEAPPELWSGSYEQQKTAAGEMSLDDAITSFTARVYAGFLPGQQTIGLATNDFKDIGDKPLHDAWVALRKRINSRKDSSWPAEYPFQSKHSRNDFILENVRSGQFFPPSNPNVYSSLKIIAKQRHGINLDSYLPEKQQSL